MEDIHERYRVFGIRHHGPGSARSLAAALERMLPDALLIEGPPDADGVLPLALSEAMVPPVALLIYAPKEPGFAAYYPFARYSPEWQSIHYGLKKSIPVRMMDLAQSVQMAMSQPEEGELPAAEGPSTPVEQPDSDNSVPALPLININDPLSALAEAAGYSDGEQWWEHLVEQYRGAAPGQRPEDLFAAILEGITALRKVTPMETNLLARRREASMRQAIRAALAEGFQRIAVVCGAWHAPALLEVGEEQTILEDGRLLGGLPRKEVSATWVPWTAARLTRASGYGAGIDAPGWYDHLWSTEDAITTRWMIRAARLLREEGLDISPAHTIEAVRLAEALAALRDRPLPGLPELHESILTVFCAGSVAPMRLIEEKLIIGEGLGSVPPETPAAPLQQDFDRETRCLRLEVNAGEKLYKLDLRKTLDLDRSHLLHRLHLLGILWGRNNTTTLQNSTSGRSGTFHEDWVLKWQPEFAVQLIEAGQYGNSIAAAAAARACHMADEVPDLPSLTALVESALLADLPKAVQYLAFRLQDQAAISSDARLLMQALPPLANVLRYGNVRQTDSAMIGVVLDGMIARICIGLPGACSALNDDAAAEMFDLLLKVDDAMSRLSEPGYQAAWQRALAQLAGWNSIHGLIAGRACRILLDGGLFSAGEAGRQLGLALSTAVDPMQAAAWVEGFLRGSGQLLIHDDRLLGILDSWLSGLAEQTFVQLLPLMRRTFSTFAQPERRNIGEQIRRIGHLRGGQNIEQADAQETNFDMARAEAVLPLITRLLGIDPAH